MSDSPRIPNMADVAARAGVSHQTVWRVVNEIGVVREGTKARVLAAIDELGYRRNLAASRLATSRSTVVGVLAPATPDFGPTSSLLAVEHAIREAGYHPLITSTDAAQARDSLDFLLEQSIQALIAIAPYQTTLAALRSLPSGLPVVVLQAGRTDVGVSVTVDQAAGMRELVRHLAGLGHTRIQHVTGPDDFIEAQLRATAFRREIERLGLPLLPSVPGDWSAQSGFRAAERLEAETTAVVCGNDQMAVGLIHALAERGVPVPQRLSVVGFDDVPESAHSLPPLTTIRQDFGRVGRRAVAALVAQLDGGGPGRAVSVSPTLVIRASTAPPRG